MNDVMLQEETEQTTYINTILATGPIRSLITFLVNKGGFSRNGKIKYDLLFF